MMIPGPSSPIPELAGTRTPFTVSPPAFHHVRNPAAIMSRLPSRIGSRKRPPCVPLPAPGLPPRQESGGNHEQAALGLAGYPLGDVYVKAVRGGAAGNSIGGTQDAD